MPLTLKCLLSQTVRADSIILWIAEGDRGLLTPRILRLEEFGLSIRFCRDIKSYKKIIPALAEFGDSFIITADDDICYGRTWLESLVRQFGGCAKEVLCHRAHRIRFSEDGMPRRYAEWEFQTTSRERSPCIFPTSGGGVLYAPGVFDPEVLNEEAFTSLCPTADDVWLYWMVRLRGGEGRLIGSSRVMDWPSLSAPSLSQENLTWGNDEAIKRMIRRYGFPRLGGDTSGRLA